MPEETPEQLSLSIIIVSYNTVGLLRDCLASIQSQPGSGYEVIVVDNASSDGSADMVRAGYPDTVLVASKTNLGFGRANNHALSMAKGELIWLLNPDTRLQKGALNAAVAFMARNPAIGMAGTALINPDGSPQLSVEKRYPGQRYAIDILGNLPGGIAWVMGAIVVPPPLLPRGNLPSPLSTSPGTSSGNNSRDTSRALPRNETGLPYGSPVSLEPCCVDRPTAPARPPQQ